MKRSSPEYHTFLWFSSQFYRFWSIYCFFNFWVFVLSAKQLLKVLDMSFSFLKIVSPSVNIIVFTIFNLSENFGFTVFKNIVIIDLTIVILSLVFVFIKPPSIWLPFLKQMQWQLLIFRKPLNLNFWVLISLFAQSISILWQWFQ